MRQLLDTAQYAPTAKYIAIERRAAAARETCEQTAQANE